MSDITRIKIPIPFPIRSVNIYFIQDSIPTLIDAGFHSKEGLDTVEHALRTKGVRLSDIKRVLLTHGHLDHVGLAGKIQESGGAEIFIHPRDRDKCIWDIETYAEKKKAPFLRFFKQGGLPDDILEAITDQMDARFKLFFPGDFEVMDLEDGGSIPFDDFTLEVIPCPGHTRGSVCFFDRENRRFFSGDHLLEKITSNPIVELETRENGAGYKSLSHYLESLSLTENLDIKEVLPGHGEPFHEHRKRIKEIKEHHHTRKEEILQVLKSHPTVPDGMNLFSITMSVFPELKAWDIFLGMSETVGHLEILEEKGLITSRMVHDQRVYQPEN
ncbi:MAG: MBL fold metallo-hydrolase [Deltaproteobacteria bacterium]|nr:MBL fold metallo-hydrolase [Deltaproteobacteria bacterium]